MTTELHDLSVAQLAAQLRAKTVSATEAAQHFLQRAEAHAGLGAFLATNAEATLMQARAADARIAAGDSAPLLGVPLAHKDIFVTTDFPTTAGSKMLDGYRSPFDSTVVSKIAGSGMVSLGKLNCDEFAMGSSNENSAFSAVKNPWDLSRVPGGSSGGSAAAVAARLTPAATGTDTGGSIRQPAAFCGITGIKPTYGRASRYGMVAFASSLDQAGPMARSAEDCALLLSAMCGPDLDRDSTSLDVPAEDFSRSLNDPLDGLRIGIPHEFFGEGLAADVRAAVDGCAQRIRKARRQAGRTSRCRKHRAVDPGLLHHRPGRGVVQPVSRFDGVQLRPPRQGLHRPGGHVQEDARRRFWRRGQAPHHDWRLRAAHTATTTPTTCRRRRSAA